MSNRPKVLVIGGGIGGLTAAHAMLRKDLDVEVFEQAPEIGEIGAGLTLSPNALKAYRGMGLKEVVEGVGYESEFQVVRQWDTGEEISRVNRTGYEDVFGAPYLSMHRADLVDALADNLPPEIVNLGAQCVGVEDLGGRALARFADGREVEADLIVGADGIHSAVRESLFGKGSPRFTGTVCWRGLVPFDVLDPEMRTKEWTLYVGPNQHVIYYMVRHGDLVNFVAHVDTDQWTGESWTQECDRSEILEVFEGWHSPLVHLLGASERYYKWALHDRDPLTAWSKGNVTLLGDAAHAMPPFIGQGAGMSVEDGYVLASAVAHSPSDIPAALALYESLRLDRANSMVLKARQARDDYHGKSKWSARASQSDDRTGIDHHSIYEYDVRDEADFTLGAATPIG